MKVFVFAVAMCVMGGVSSCVKMTETLSFKDFESASLKIYEDGEVRHEYEGVARRFSQSEREVVEKWIADDLASARVDFTTYVPCVVLSSSRFVVNFTRVKTIFNVSNDDGKWRQYSRERNEADGRLLNVFASHGCVLTKFAP